MAEPVCPSCRAALDEDLVASTGKAECPFCGADVSALDFGADEPPLFDESTSVPFEDALNAETSVDVGEEETEFGRPGEGSDSLRPPARPKERTARPAGDAPLPKKSKIQVVESTPDRKVIFLPAGGGASTAIGVFALFWNGFMMIFTPAFLLGGNAGGNAPPWLVLIPFLGLFWAVGLGMIYFWIRMRFTRVYLLLESDRVVVQRVLFGNKKMTETLVGPETRAALQEAYQQNNHPVYCVAVNGTNRTEKFGTSLSDGEKDWLVDTINAFLGSAGVAGACEALLEHSGGEVPAALSPHELPANGQIVLEAASPERLAFRVAVLPPGKMRRSVGRMAVTAVVLPIVMHVVLAVMGIDIEFLLNVMLLAFPVLFALVLAAAVWCELSVELTRDRLRTRWEVQRLGWGYTREVPTGAITRIVVSSGPQHRRGVRNPRRGGVDDVRYCTVHAGAKTLSVSPLSEDPVVGRQAGGMLRYQLEQMGFRIDDA